MLLLLRVTPCTVGAAVRRDACVRLPQDEICLHRQMGQNAFRWHIVGLRAICVVLALPNSGA